MESNKIKILLTIYMEGGTLVRQEKPEFISFNITRNLSNKDKKTESGTRKHYNHIAKDVTRSIKFSVETYNMMLKEPPSKMRYEDFIKLTNTQKIEKHLWDYCHDLRGKSFTYQIIDD